MNNKAIKHVIDYVEEQAVPCQITYIGDGEFVLDCQSDTHTKVVYEELKEQGYKVSLGAGAFYSRIK